MGFGELFGLLVLAGIAFQGGRLFERHKLGKEGKLKADPK